MSFMASKKMLLSGARPLRPEDVLATSLYTGTGNARDVFNGLDLAGKGGLVWGKSRNLGVDHWLADTMRGNGILASNTTAAEVADTSIFRGFTSQGFTVGTGQRSNQNGAIYVAWAFRRAKNFLDIVTYTGNGVAGRQIPHSLGVAPGMMVVFARSAQRNRFVYHRSAGANANGILNSDNAFAANSPAWNGTAPTASSFTLGADPEVNESGITYVAYLFAHNPDLIDCGIYTGNGSDTGPLVMCGSGWRPQFLMIKVMSSTAEGLLLDSARGLGPSGVDNVLIPSSNGPENSIVGGDNNLADTTPSGFQPKAASFRINMADQRYIYLAIRSPT